MRFKERFMNANNCLKLIFLCSHSCATWMEANTLILVVVKKKKINNKTPFVCKRNNFRVMWLDTSQREKP